MCDLEAVIAEHHEDPDVEAARELYVRLVQFARGRLDEASSPSEVRVALRALFEDAAIGYVGDRLAVAAGLRLIRPDGGLGMVEPQPETFVNRPRRRLRRDDPIAARPLGRVEPVIGQGGERAGRVSLARGGEAHARGDLEAGDDVVPRLLADGRPQALAARRGGVRARARHEHDELL